MDTTTLNTIAADYNERVVANTHEGWNAAAAVLVDSTGEVVYELADTARDLGYDLDQDEWDALYDVWHGTYRVRLLAAARLFPAVNGEI